MGVVVVCCDGGDGWSRPLSDVPDDAVDVEALRLDFDDFDPLVQAAVEAIDDKLGADPVVLQVGEVLGIAEYFVVGSGANPRQVRAIAEEAERLIKERTGRSPLRTEGRGDWQWVVFDYGETVVHVFDHDVRDFYELERLWADVPAWRRERS